MPRRSTRSTSARSSLGSIAAAIADVIASQAHAYLQANLPAIYDNPEAIEHARRHYLAPGNSIPWREKIRNGTGQDLSYASLARDMTNPYPDA